MKRLNILLMLATVLLLQGCVVPAAVDAMKRYTHYDLVSFKEVDDKNFYALISIEHSRGAFDPLAGHGNPFVTTQVDLQLWHLTLADKNIVMKKTDEIIFKSEDDLNNQSRLIKNIEIDKARGRLVFLKEPTPLKTDSILVGNFRINLKTKDVFDQVKGKECTLSSIENLLKPDWSKQFLADASGTYLMIASSLDKKLEAVIINPCNAKAPGLEIKTALRTAVDFSVNNNGSLKWVSGTFYNKNADLGENLSYEVELFPNHEHLIFNEKKLGLSDSFRSPSIFIFDDKTKRFYWLAFPDADKPSFVFITHDFVTGLIAKREANF